VQGLGIAGARDEVILDTLVKPPHPVPVTSPLPLITPRPCAVTGLDGGDETKFMLTYSEFHDRSRIDRTDSSCSLAPHDIACSHVRAHTCCSVSSHNTACRYWITGPRSQACRIVTLSVRSRMPIVSYFCPICHANNRQGDSLQ
jgi:hypothetical protein